MVLSRHKSLYLWLCLNVAIAYFDDLREKYRNHSCCAEQYTCLLHLRKAQVPGASVTYSGASLNVCSDLCHPHPMIIFLLHLEWLTDYHPIAIERRAFRPTGIYPCSAACAGRFEPCEQCLHTVRAESPFLQLLPRIPLRQPLAMFLQSVRDRLIEDIAEASKLQPRGRTVTRMKGGFLLGSVLLSSEWGSGWEYNVRSRTMIYCHLQVHITFSMRDSSVARLIIQPVMRSTYYLPLCSSLPLPAGAPVVLLPHGVPAYYLSTYSGPSAALTAQFDEALVGLGAGDWKQTTHPRPSDAAPEHSTYIVVWLAVQNKQGEDKGMPLIWPAGLCVSYHASSPSAHARSSLPCIPELPAQLQASPPPPTAAIPPGLSFDSATSPSGDIPTSATAPSTVPSAERDRLTSSFRRRPSLLRSSLTSDSLRAFCALSLSRKPYFREVKRVATEVNSYVDSVVKERDRERERIRRERQEQEIAAARAKLASTRPPPEVEPPVPLAADPELAPTPQQEATPAIPATPVVSAPVDPPEMESSPAAESDHSVDSLFSPVDATIDLPSTEEETQSALEAPVEDAPAVLPEAQAPPIVPEVGVSSTPANDDVFHAFESNWSQQSGGYMDMEYEMDFGGMNLDSLGGARAGGTGGGFDLDDGLPFTDDDFAFFNAPPSQTDIVASAYPPHSAPVAGTIAINAAPLGLEPLNTMDTTLSGPGPPSAGTALPSPWPPQLGEPFTPRGTVDMQGVLDMSAPPELLPPSPARTLSTHSAPATPSVHLTEVYDERRVDGMPAGLSIFDPIPFAMSHRQNDGKYAVGKFALPSPPAEQDGAELWVHKSPVPFLRSGWKHKYSAITDPRIGVVRKLIGVKRKSTDQGARDRRRMPLWESYREQEDWQGSSPPPAEVDSEESDDEPWMEEDDVPLVTATVPRPSTPPPAYLPLGPSLLRTHFHHAYLLPMCTPLRPLGLVVSNTPGNTAPMSVPTPVSPAAVLGAASEKSKSLEAAAQILVKEVVENPVWSEAWRANASLSFTPPVLPSKAWQTDALYIKHLVFGDGTSPTLQTILDTGAPSHADSRPELITCLSRTAFE